MEKEVTKKHRWLIPCRHCGKKHLWEMGTCPSCGVYETFVLVSENVSCYHRQKCEGCESYDEHLQA